jgi:hypothetical protein
MRIIAMIAASATVLAVAPAAAQPASAGSPDYAKGASWLCLPGRADTCSAPLPTTALNPNGYGSNGPSTVAKNPPVDCFYVYPTVSTDRGLKSDMIPGRDEKLATETQFARFASVCRPFAPIYRQMTLGSVAAFAAGMDITDAAALAYRDVASAWRDYWRNRNRGRPFVLIGHSQGSAMLQELIAREIETNPAALARMKLAIIPGFNLLVPQGRTTGGSFKKVPLCTREGQEGCVLSWVSFRDKNVPPRGAIFGYADKPGMTVACTNPARPGAAGWQRLDSYWFTRSTLPVAGGPIRWSSEGAPPTPYVRTEGLASAQCVNDGPRGFLSIRTNGNAADKRTDRIGGEVAVLGMFLPGWGMHLADMSLALGDLIRRVGSLGGR